MADKITLITYEDFEKNINDIRTLRKFQSSLNSVFDEYNRKKGDCTTLWFPSLENNLVDLLEKITHDKDEWIRYWIYELDFGWKYSKGCVEIDNKLIMLLTVYDLWNLLNNRPHFEDG